MPRAARDVVEKRPVEILEGCRKLYKEKSFREITLKDISVETRNTRLHTDIFQRDYAEGYQCGDEYFASINL